MFLLLLKMRTVGLWAWALVNIQQQISWVSKETFLELLTSCNFCGKYLEISSCRHQRNSSQQQQLIFSKSLPMGGGSDPQKHHRYVNWKNGRLEESRIIFDCNYSRIHCAFFFFIIRNCNVMTLMLHLVGLNGQTQAWHVGRQAEDFCMVLQHYRYCGFHMLTRRRSI